MLQSVSGLSIAAMAVAAVLAIAVPVVAAVFLIKKTKGNAINIIVGAGTFVVFALILETILHQIVFRIFGEQLNANIWLYAFYGGLAAGLFEETGRFISMKLFMKKSLTKENAVVFGIGHGGAEALLVGGLTYISNIFMSVMINMNAFDILLKGTDDSMKTQVYEQISALWTTPANQFLLAGVERVFAFALQICLSYIVYRAVRYKKPAFYFLALALHFAVDACVVILAKKTQLWLVELILAAAVVCIALITYKVYKKEKCQTE